MKNLKIIYNNIFPFKGFYCINLFGNIFIRYENSNKEVYPSSLNHEGIHECQSEDFIKNSKNNKIVFVINYLIFYFLYFIEFLIKLICKFFYWKIKAYESISFEQEANLFENNFNYQEIRIRYAWTKYLFNFIINE